MSEIKPLHHSELKSNIKAPKGMSVMRLTHEQREFIESIALSIFSDMSNAGCSLQQTLAAIYLSGSENALSAKWEGK